MYSPDLDIATAIMKTFSEIKLTHLGIYKSLMKTCLNILI